MQQLLTEHLWWALYEQRNQNFVAISPFSERPTGSVSHELVLVVPVKSPAVDNKAEFLNLTRGELTFESFIELSQTVGCLGWPSSIVGDGHRIDHLGQCQPCLKWIKAWADLKNAAELWSKGLDPGRNENTRNNWLREHITLGNAHRYAARSYNYNAPPPLDNALLDLLAGNDASLEGVTEEESRTHLRTQFSTRYSLIYDVPMRSVTTPEVSAEEQRKIAASQMLARAVSNGLKGKVYPTLEWSEHQSKLVRNEATSEGNLGILWLQLLQAVVGNEEFLECEQCGDYYPVAGRAKGKKNRFCGDSCRGKHWRARQAPGSSPTTKGRTKV